MITEEIDKVCESQSEDLKQCLYYEYCHNYAGYSDRIELGKYDLEHEDLCFSCDHWTEMLEAKGSNEMYYLRVGGRHYQTYKNSLFRMPGKYNGFGGRKFIFKLKETGEVFDTYNMWTQGTIPEHFKDKLYDNAEFVNQVTETVVYDGEQFITAFDIRS